MEYIPTLIKTLLEQHRSSDIIEREFKRLINSDDAIKNEYHSWCDTNEYNYKEGFHFFIEEYLESQEEIWNHLEEYDNYN